MLKSKMREIQSRAQQSLPADVALDTINAGEGLGPESGVLLNYGVFNDEARSRQDTNRHLAESDVTVQDTLQPRLQTAAVPFCAEIRGNEPRCDPAQEKGQQGDANASVDPWAHQRAIIKVRRQRVLVGR
jgi:hypothetical protein